MSTTPFSYQPSSFINIFRHHQQLTQILGPRRAKMAQKNGPKRAKLPYYPN